MLIIRRVFLIKPTPEFWPKTEHCCVRMLIARMILIVLSRLRAKVAFQRWASHHCTSHKESSLIILSGL
jgi:hypothetical protein